MSIYHSSPWTPITHAHKPKCELVHLCSCSSVLKILLSPVLWVKFIHFSKPQHKVERGSSTLPPLGEGWLCPLLCSLFWKYFPVSKGFGLLHVYPHLLLGCLLDRLGSKKLPSQKHPCSRAPEVVRMLSDASGQCRSMFYHVFILTL